MKRIVWLLLPLALLALPVTGAGRVELRHVRDLPLQKTEGRVDQVVERAGSLVVRDSDYWQEEQQVIEVYATDGERQGVIGRFGRSPGQYFRLKDLEVASDGTLWVADVLSRITTFDPAGKLQKTLLVQRPGYQVHDLVLDERRGYFYVGGCLPTQTYLDLGCLLLHQYRLRDRRYIRSFVETDPEALEKRLLALQDVVLALDSRGRVFVADAPIFKVIRLEPKSGESVVLPLTSRIVRPAPALDPRAAPEVARKRFSEAFLIDRLAISGGCLVVSIRRPADTGHLLTVIDAESGESLLVDHPAPGRLVGERGGDGLLFVDRKPGESYRLSQYRLEGCAGRGEGVGAKR
jgi:hypothetical protein